MSFFTRALVGAALVAGIVHVFRKDLQKVAKVLQKPAENFVKEVKKELDATSAQKVAGSLPTAAAGGEGAAAEAAERARVAAAAAQEVAQKGAPKPAPAAGGEPAGSSSSNDQAPPLR
jgi:uncharacterized protein HemX